MMTQSRKFIYAEHMLPVKFLARNYWDQLWTSQLLLRVSRNIVANLESMKQTKIVLSFNIHFTYSSVKIIIIDS